MKGYKNCDKDLRCRDFQFVRCFDFRYIINKSGEIYSLIGPSGIRKKLHLLKSSVGRDGYKKVVLYKDNKQKTRTSVHRILASVFLNLNFEDKSIVVNHKDGNKLNNKLKNLQLCTKKENSQHAALKGLYRKNVKSSFTNAEKRRLLALPNFDKKVFKDISGIDLDLDLDKK